MRRFIPILILGMLLGCGAQERKAYMRHPLVKASNVIAGPDTEPETATQVDPYPPPRPVLPDEPSNLVTVPLIKSAERTPAD